MNCIRAILIDGPSRLIHEYDIRPTHLAIEEAIGTRFWDRRKLSNGDVLYHAREIVPEDTPTFYFDGWGYKGSGLIVRLDRYFDLESAHMALDDAAALTHFADIRDDIQADS